MDFRAHLSEKTLAAHGPGPLYMRLRRVLTDLIARHELPVGQPLPTERDLAEMTGLSRVTIRKAVEDLVTSGQLIRRHGSGTFVAPKPNKMQQSLSELTSLTEDMTRRGVKTHSQWLKRALFVPSPNEVMAFGLSLGAKVARLKRLRFAAEAPLAVERVSIPAEFLPDPERVENSLYDALSARNVRPTRATQRIAARMVQPDDAALLGVAAGDAVLFIERISYLPSGRVVELTRSVYRADAYDFVAELRMPAPPTEPT